MIRHSLYWTPYRRCEIAKSFSRLSLCLNCLFYSIDVLRCTSRANNHEFSERPFTHTLQNFNERKIKITKNRWQKTYILYKYNTDVQYKHCFQLYYDSCRNLPGSLCYPLQLYGFWLTKKSLCQPGKNVVLKSPPGKSLFPVIYYAFWLMKLSLCHPRKDVVLKSRLGKPLLPI